MPSLSCLVAFYMLPIMQQILLHHVSFMETTGPLLDFTLPWISGPDRGTSYHITSWKLMLKSGKGVSESRDTAEMQE
jgi:hypothetical protein